VPQEGFAAALVEWLTAPGVWNTSPTSRVSFLSAKARTSSVFIQGGQYPASLTKYSSWLDAKLAVQYRRYGALWPETVEIEKVDEMTQRSTFIPTDNSKRVTKEKKRCPCDALTPNVQEFRPRG
jgi:hypothetical protein